MKTLYLHPTSVQEVECGSYRDKAIRVYTSGNNGIPEWIRHREKVSQITVELHLDWHKNNDFLGFAIYSVWNPLDPDRLNCKLNFCGDGEESGSWDVDDVTSLCFECGVGSYQMSVVYYPKLAIEKHYWSNKWRRLKASFHGLDNLPVEVKECGIHLIYTQDIPEDTDTDIDIDDAHRRWEEYNQLMIEYNDDHCEDAIASAQTSYHHTQFPEHSDDRSPPMDTTTQNVINNVVDAQDDEDDRTHNWLELLCNFVQWICCRRY